MSSAPQSIALRPGHPDFLDLPWDQPLTYWKEHCPRAEELPRGLSRHPVVFINYDNELYALKELPPELAKKEYATLRQIEDLHLPAVQAVGHARTRTTQGENSVLITRYLEYSLPYRSLLMQQGLVRYQEHLLDAMAALLVQLHLAGVFWGDCSLSNTLFRRDAGTLQAYLVDAETTEVHPRLSKNLRQHDLDIMQENITGALLDLEAAGALPQGFPPLETADSILERYQCLWDEITREEIITPHENYLIHERIQSLNKLGFSVDEVKLQPTEDGDRLRMRVFVTDRHFHRNQLHSLTGLDTEEMQARQMMNEIQQLRATLSRQNNRSIPISVAAHFWLNQMYRPVVEALEPLIATGTDPAELYCQVLEHKWYLSEQAQRDVGHQAALEDFLKRFAP